MKQLKRRSTSKKFCKRDYSAHKCATHCERMIKVLVRHFIVMLKHKYFPSRWLDVLDVMTENWKVHKINKLRIKQIIEEDLQLLMRIFLGIRTKESYENDKRR